MKKLVILSVVAILFQSCGNQNKPPLSKEKAFSFERTYVYHGNPEFVYDHLTGDISAWWDHSFSQDPYELFIEARPGGGFYEYFDDAGDGVLHATVIGAERGKMLRMDGALGLAGQALTLISTYQLNPIGCDSTELVLKVHGSGEIEKGIPDNVEQVWHHFLGEQFTPYIDSIMNTIQPEQ